MSIYLKDDKAVVVSLRKKPTRKELEASRIIEEYCEICNKIFKNHSSGSIEAFEKQLDSTLLQIPTKTSRVKFQAEKYREIFNPIETIYDQANKSFNKTGENESLFETLHIPGLEKLFESGIAATFKVLKKSFLNNWMLREEFKENIEKLVKIYDKAKKLDNNSCFTEFKFLCFNYKLCCLAEEGKCGNVKPVDTKTFLSTLKNIKKIMAEKKLNLFQPKIIIYGNSEKSTPIGYESFVRELLHDKYKAHLLLVDFAPREYSNSPFSKKHAHYSLFQSTNNMFRHDLEHAKIIINKDVEEYNLPRNQIMLKYINSIRNKFQEDSNEYLVLTRVLFLLAHEIQTGLELNQELDQKQQAIDSIKQLEEILIKSTELSRSSDEYKIFNRDNEKVLFSNKKNNECKTSLKGIGEQPFVSNPLKGLKDWKKQEIIREGYRAFCAYTRYLINGPAPL